MIRINKPKLNKKAQVFPVWLVIITLFMCSFSIYLYFLQVKTINSSLVAPVGLLKVYSEQELFEMQEESIIFSALEDTIQQTKVNAEQTSAKEWGKDSNFNLWFRVNLVKYLMKDEQKQFRNFIFKDLVVSGAHIDEENLNDEEKEKFFYNLYSGEFSEENGEENFILKRQGITKSLILTAPELSKKNFPMQVNYEFGREYKIKYKDERFELVPKESFDRLEGFSKPRFIFVGYDYSGFSEKSFRDYAYDLFISQPELSGDFSFEVVNSGVLELRFNENKNNPAEYAETEISKYVSYYDRKRDYIIGIHSDLQNGDKIIKISDNIYLFDWNEKELFKEEFKGAVDKLSAERN